MVIFIAVVVVALALVIALGTRILQGVSMGLEAKTKKLQEQRDQQP